MELSEIKEYFAEDPETLLETLGLEYRNRGTRLEVLCPFHSDNNIGNAVIKNGYFYCFACNSKADCFELVKQVMNCTFSVAVKTVCEAYGINYSGRANFNKDTLSLTAAERTALAMPKTPFSVNRLTEADKKTIYLRRIDVMLKKYDELIRLYGDCDAEEAWRLSELADANTVTFAKIKRECENRKSALLALKKKIGG